MKKSRIIISVVLAILLCIPLAMFSFASSEDGSYTITNQYADVDWDAVTPYKTALHTHTNASDGHDTLRQSIGRQAEHGFDIIATTDHGTVNYSWEKENVNPLIFSALKIVGKTDGKLDYLGKSGEFPDGTKYTLDKNKNGDEILTLEDGRQILRLPYGNEQNAISANSHVQTWFDDYTDNTVSTYEDTIKAIDQRGGISIINHPGEYTKAKEEIHSESAYNENNPAYRYYINKFANLIHTYDSCKGIDINSKGDSRTRFDRILWDNLLKRFSANGETVYAIASSDAHNLGVTNSGFTWLLMKEFNNEETRRVLEAGEMFPASHNIGNIDELIDIAEGVRTFYGEDNEIYKRLTETINAMDEKITGIENGKYSADSTIGIEYETTDENGYALYDTDPMVTSININEDTDEITLNTENAMIVRWISNGKLICTQKADAATIDLNDYSRKLGNYIRAEVFGEGGILYTEPFLLNAEENAGKSNPVDKGYFNIGFMDFMFAIVNNWLDVLNRSVSNIFQS